MLIECPNCGAKYTLDEKVFAGRASVQGKCGKCQTSFSVGAPTTMSAEFHAPAPAADDKTRVSKYTTAGQLPSDKVVSLSVIDGPAKGKLFRLSKPEVTIGRSGTDVVIDDPEISRKHCSIVVNGSTATLADLGTTNGTLVDGARVSTCELHHLSEFRIGASTVMFTVTAKAAAESAS